MLTTIVTTSSQYQVNGIHYYDGCKYYIAEIETQGNLSRLWLKPVQGE